MPPQVLLEDRNIASDWILRELLPPDLDADDLDLEIQLQETNIADACPPGPKGLLCRRRFALRGADECAGGESAVGGGGVFGGGCGTGSVDVVECEGVWGRGVWCCYSVSGRLSQLSRCLLVTQVTSRGPDPNRRNRISRVL